MSPGGSASGWWELPLGHLWSVGACSRGQDVPRWLGPARMVMGRGHEERVLHLDEGWVRPLARDSKLVAASPEGTQALLFNQGRLVVASVPG